MKKHVRELLALYSVHAWFLNFLSLDSIEGVWYPKEKIRQAKKKLQGHNPAYVMRTELTLGHEKTAEYPALKIILMGDKKYSKRVRVSIAVVISD